MTYKYTVFLPQNYELCELSSNLREEIKNKELQNIVYFNFPFENQEKRIYRQH